MRELPEGWLRLPLRDLVGPNGLISDGDWVESKDQDPNGEIRLLQLADIGDGVFLDRSTRYVNEDAFRRLRCTELRPGDVLVARMPDPLGRACITPKLDQRAITVVDVAIVRPGDPAISTGCVKYFLNSPGIRREIELLASGTTRRRISRSKLEGVKLPVPPPQEQVRIAGKLDSLFARFSKCRERLERAPEILERFRGAVLDTAVSGRLTEEWRKRAKFQFPSEPDWLPLASLCSPGRVITYGVIKLGEPVHNGVPCLRTSNVRWLHLDTDGMKLIDPELSAQYPRTVLKGSEVLVNVRGTLGGVVAVTPNMRGWNVSREVAVVPADGARINPRFLALWIAARRSQNWLQRVQKGVAYTGINIEDLRTLPVAVPSGEEQAEIVRRVVALFKLADRIEQKHQLASRRVERLSPAILGRAFRGQLVPQVPGEEPTKEMLERIRAAQKRPELNESGTATVIVRGRGRAKRGIGKERDVRRRKRA